MDNISGRQLSSLQKRILPTCQAVEKGNVHYWDMTTVDWKFVEFISLLICSKFHAEWSSLCVLANVVLLCYFLAIVTLMQWYNPELTCISLMTSDTEVEYLFRSLFTVHKSSLMEFLSKCFALFFNRSFAFLLLSFENYLSILDTFYKSFLKYVYYKIFLPV